MQCGHAAAAASGAPPRWRSSAGFPAAVCPTGETVLPASERNRPMAGTSRRKLLGKRRKAVFHCTSRCVRRAFLCGLDPLTGKDFSHRRDWITCREEQLAGLFAIEIQFRAEMSNHLHAVLRTRPRLAYRISGHDVARRWLTITKSAKCMSNGLPKVSDQEVNALARDKKRIAKLRKRLSNISWFMGILLENVARRANKEDEASGRFWETRFKSREITDPSGLLVCGVYVDLNPIKAGEAESPRTAHHTSFYDRAKAARQPKNSPRRADGWMAEFTVPPERKADEKWAEKSRTGRRASDLGVLELSLNDYEKLLNWTIQQFRSGERSTIPRDLAKVLELFDVQEEEWIDTILDYNELFCHAVGASGSLAEVAERLGVGYLRGGPACRNIFG